MSRNHFKQTNLVVISLRFPRADTSTHNGRSRSNSLTDNIDRKRSRSQSNRSGDSSKEDFIVDINSCADSLKRVGSSKPQTITPQRIQQFQSGQHVKDTKDEPNPKHAVLSPTKRQNLKVGKTVLKSKKIDGADLKQNPSTSCQCYLRKCLGDQCGCFRAGMMCGTDCGCYQCRNNEYFTDRLKKAKGVLKKD